MAVVASVKGIGVIRAQVICHNCSKLIAVLYLAYASGILLVCEGFVFIVKAPPDVAFDLLSIIVGYAQVGAVNVGTVAAQDILLFHFGNNAAVDVVRCAGIQFEQPFHFCQPVRVAGIKLVACVGRDQRNAVNGVDVAPGDFAYPDRVISVNVEQIVVIEGVVHRIGWQEYNIGVAEVFYAHIVAGDQLFPVYGGIQAPV